MAEESKDLTQLLRKAEEMVWSKRLILEGAHVHQPGWLGRVGWQVGQSRILFHAPVVVGKGWCRKVSM